MKTSLFRRSMFLLPLACVALYGCPPAETETTPDEEEYADVIYGGGATDEALIALGSALDQAAPVEDPARAPVLDSPTEAELPRSPIPTFSWHHGNKASLRAPGHDAPAGPSLLRLATTAPSWARPLTELLGPPRAARAHGDPVNGTATFLTFSTKSNAKLVRVFTTETSLTLGQESWDKIADAGEEVTLSLVAADFDNNRIADGGAPVQGTKYTFTVAP